MKYKVLEQLHFDNEAYGVDDIVDMTEDQAVGLLSLGIIAELPKEKSAKADK